MIQIIIDIIIILMLFALFGFFHSLLASLKVKEFLTEKLGSYMAFYRLFYNLLSIVMIIILFDIAPRPDVQLYNLNYPLDLIVIIPQLLSLGGIFWTLKYFCVREFLGINQIIRWFNKSYDTRELDEHLTLRIGGPYRYMRHPLYFFSITLLLFRAEMNLYYLVFLLCIIAYFYIGSLYEERKLLAQFGSDYRNYMEEVPRIIPYKLFKKT